MCTKRKERAVPEAAPSAAVRPRPFVLRGFFRSGGSWCVRIALGLKGLSVTDVPRHLRRGEQRAPDCLPPNPQGLVPALELGNGTVLTQSLAIVEWADEAFPAPLLLADPSTARPRPCPRAPRRHPPVAKPRRARPPARDGSVGGGAGLGRSRQRRGIGRLRNPSCGRARPTLLWQCAGLGRSLHDTAIWQCPALWRRSGPFSSAACRRSRMPGAACLRGRRTCPPAGCRVRP